MKFLIFLTLFGMATTTAAFSQTKKSNDADNKEGQDLILSSGGSNGQNTVNSGPLGKSDGPRTGSFYSDLKSDGKRTLSYVADER